MLNLNSLMATRDFVHELGNENLLVAIPNSPIAESIAATKVQGISAKTPNDIDMLPDALFTLNEVKLENGAVIPDIHSLFLEETAVRIGGVIASHVDYALNVVGTKAKELNDEILGQLDVLNNNPLKAYRVLPESSSSLFNEPSFVNEIQKYRNIDVTKDSDLVLDYKNISDQDIILMMKIGSGNFDVAVDEFVTNVGMPFLQEVWNVVFQSNKNGFNTYNAFRVEKGLNANIATFLFASKLIQDENVIFNVTGTSGLNASKYVFILKDLQEISGCALCAHFDAKTRESNTGKLITRVEDKTVYVDKNIYDRYLQEGGDVEAILGSVLNGNRVYYIDEIVEKKDTFIRAWNHHVAIEKANSDENSIALVKTILNSFTRKCIISSEEEVIKNNSETIINNTIDWANKLVNEDLKDINSLATRFLCETIYSFTDSYKILNGVNTALSANPDLSAEDALTSSLITYVAGWYASQVRLQS